MCERFCGLYARSISSRRHPYASLNRRALELQTLQAVINKYDLQAELPTYTRMHDNKGLIPFTTPEYSTITLLHPRKVLGFVRNNLASLKTRIGRHFVTRYGGTLQYFKARIGHTIEQYGRLELANHDRINSLATTAATASKRRDATFIEYELRIDRLARRHHAPPQFEAETWFGQVDRIFVVRLPACPEIDDVEIHQPRTFILLDVHSCTSRKDADGIYNYSHFGQYEVVDAICFRSLVGRIFDRGEWAFVRRPTARTHDPDLDDEDDGDGD